MDLDSGGELMTFSPMYQTAIYLIKYNIFPWKSYSVTHPPHTIHLAKPYLNIMRTRLGLFQFLPLPCSSCWVLCDLKVITLPASYNTWWCRAWTWWGGRILRQYDYRHVWHVSELVYPHRLALLWLWMVPVLGLSVVVWGRVHVLALWCLGGLNPEVYRCVLGCSWHEPCSNLWSCLAGQVLLSWRLAPMSRATGLVGEGLGPWCWMWFEDMSDLVIAIQHTCQDSMNQEPYLEISGISDSDAFLVASMSLTAIIHFSIIHGI